MPQRDIIKDQYLFLKETGELEELVPNMSGDWSKDKNKFTKIYEQLQRMLRG